MISLTAISSPTITARSELLGYSELAFVVFEAARPENQLRVVELSEYRAIREASIHLGISAEKLRAHRAPGSLSSLGRA